jgi:hypothetical protein
VRRNESVKHGPRSRARYSGEHFLPFTTTYIFHRVEYSHFEYLNVKHSYVSLLRVTHTELFRRQPYSVSASKTPQLVNPVRLHHMDILTSYTSKPLSAAADVLDGCSWEDAIFRLCSRYYFCSPQQCYRTIPSIPCAQQNTKIISCR